MSNWPLSLVAEILFTLPVSEAVVEILFTLTDWVKPTARASLGEKRLSTTIRICHEGPDLKNFNATKVMQLWYIVNLDHLDKKRIGPAIEMRTCL